MFAMFVPNFPLDGWKLFFVVLAIVLIL